MTTVAIIGAGPAGAAAAHALARRGFHAHLFEARAFPRSKVCGEFISPAATHLLESLLPPDTLLAAGAQRVRTFHLTCAHRSISWDMPTHAWVLSRLTLDPLLLQHARDAGATIHQPTLVRRVEYSPDHALLHMDDAPPFRADLVIHADGVGRHDPRGPVPTRRHLVGCKTHLRLPETQRITGLHMRALPGAALGLLTVEGGRTNVALTLRRTRLRDARADLDAALHALWPDYDPAWRIDDWHACPVPDSRPIPGAHPRSFRIGNAAAAVDPVSGEGIGLALWSALTLAALLDPHDLPATARRFHRAYSRRLRIRRPASRLAGHLLMRPALVSALWPLLRHTSIGIRPWYAMTGKPLRPLMVATSPRS